MEFNHNTHGADGYSVCGFMLFMLLQISEHFDASNPMTWLGAAVGLSTLYYNIIRIRKEKKS